jgi:hypothetical protein
MTRWHGSLGSTKMENLGQKSRGHNCVKSRQKSRGHNCVKLRQKSRGHICVKLRQKSHGHNLLKVAPKITWPQLRKVAPKITRPQLRKVAPKIALPQLRKIAPKITRPLRKLEQLSSKMANQNFEPRYSNMLITGNAIRVSTFQNKMSKFCFSCFGNEISNASVFKRNGADQCDLMSL